MVCHSVGNDCQIDNKFLLQEKGTSATRDAGWIRFYV